MGSPKAASSPSSVTQTTVQEVPEEVKPLLGRYLSQGEALSKTPFSAYSGERVAGLNPYHNAGGDLAATRAIYGDPGVEAGRQNVAGMLSGDYYNSPAFAHASRRGLDHIQGTVGSMFGAQGLSNSGVQQQAMRDANDFQMGMINQEQQRMPQYLSAALQYGQEPYEAAGQLLGMGDMYRDYDQARINSQREQFDERRMYPYQQQDLMGALINTGMGGRGTTTQTSPGYYQPSRTAGMLGGGLAGYGLASQSPNFNNYLAAGLGGALGAYS